VLWANGLVGTLVVIALALLLWGPAGDAIAALRSRGAAAKTPKAAE
jgi:uncharacterized protein YbjT (DUF2867 family)